MPLIQELDYGTPAIVAEKTVTLSIDGHEVTVPEGTSIMRAAAEAGIKVPKLCATDTLNSFGSCRLCLVEIEGRPGTPASCTTLAAPGMKVHTAGEKVRRIRRGVMELYISDHPLDCLTCSANGNCELQDAAGEVGLRDVRYGYDGANHLAAPVDASNPYFQFDPAKCIVCSRCVRACEEVQGTFALTVQARGFASKIAAGMDEPFLASECVSCGACVQACPTATLIEKTVVDLGQAEHSVITTCAYCGVGCNFKAEMRGDTVVRMVPWKDGRANHGHSCVKGRFAWGYANHQDRILNPMVRDRITDPWREVTWEEAIGRVASEFKRIQAEAGRNSIGVITSSRCTDEETYLVQKLARQVFGNNNTDTCARVCHSPTGYGLRTTFGTSAGTQDFDSVDQSDVIMVIGANPTDGHPVFASRKAPAARGREADCGRSAAHRPGAHAARRGEPPSGVAPRHQCGRADLAGARRRHRGSGERDLRARTLRCRGVRRLGFVRVRTAQQPGGGREDQRRSGGDHPRGCPSVRRRAQRRDLLWARRHRAQPGQHRGDGVGKPRDGDWQYRPARRRGESAARP